MPTGVRGTVLTVDYADWFVVGIAYLNLRIVNALSAQCRQAARCIWPNNNATGRGKHRHSGQHYHPTTQTHLPDWG